MKEGSRIALVLIACWLLATIANFCLGRFDDWMAPQTPWQHWSKYAPAWYVNYRASILLLADILPGLLTGFIIARRSIAMGALLGALLASTPIIAGELLYGPPWQFGATVPGALNTILLTTPSSAAGALLRTRGVA